MQNILQLGKKNILQVKNDLHYLQTFKKILYYLKINKIYIIYFFDHLCWINFKFV